MISHFTHFMLLPYLRIHYLY